MTTVDVQKDLMPKIEEVKNLRRINGDGILDPKDLGESPLSIDDMKMLERKKYIIKGSDLDIFDMLPLDNKGKADLLRHLMKESMEKKE